MKNAYQYVRISDDDQSHFSIEGQQKMIADFAARHNIKIQKTFIDDGYSAKDFNRPNWKILEKELAQNKSKVDFLIVWKYDRLIRNAAQGLNFIEKMERKWNITLLSVMENFGIEPSSPFFFKNRADLLVSAEFERRLIADRTKMGNWTAKGAGRYIGRASLGYINARDEKNLPILKVDETRKAVVQNIFDDFLNDLPYPSIRKRAEEKGVKIKGHDAIKNILSNHVYAGLIRVPEYHGQKSYIKEGIHEPIISLDKFWKAYYKLQDKVKPQGQKITDSEIPLRGYLLCQSCGGLHTGGKSKGRTKYYYYYRCKKCVGENYRAETVHEELKTILNSLSLKPNLLEKLKTNTEIRYKEALAGRQVSLKRVQAEFNAANEKLTSLEEKFITNKINLETYEKWFPIFSKEVNLKAGEIEQLSKDNSKQLEKLLTVIPYLGDLNKVYEIADVDDKQALLKEIFWGGLTKEKTGGRTKILNPIFEPNSNEISTLLRIDETKKFGKLPNFPDCTRKGT